MVGRAAAKQHPPPMSNPPLQGSTLLTAACAVSLALLPAFSGCSSDPDPAPPPAPAEALGAAHACLFSYSCPAGMHCDLKRCVQGCNADNPCAEGLSCTARGRCAASAEEPSDPPSSTSAGVLRAPESVVTLRDDQTHIPLRLLGEGRVRARIESTAEWLQPDDAAFEFEGEAEVGIPIVREAASSADGLSHTATLRIVSSQGDRHVIVKRRPALTGVWTGAIAHTAIPLGGQTFALDLGETRFSLHVQDDDDGLRARIDPEESTLWPASSNGPTATFEASVEDGLAELRFVQLLDGSSAAPLYPAHGASVFSQSAIGRELTLRLQLTDDGALQGTATEAIHGLTTDPVVVEGQVRLTLVPDATVVAFPSAAAVSLPVGPIRDPGVAGTTCPPSTVPGCESGTWACLADPEQGLLASGYALSNFFAPRSTRTPVFRFTPETTGGVNTPYAAATAACLAELPADLRADTRGATNTCVDLEMLACARWYSASTLSGGLSHQGSMYTARAYLELFSMLANEAYVEAKTRRYTTTATASELRGLYLAAHQRYGAGLYRFFDPRLFEELRAVGAEDAQLGAMSPEYDNDRIPLRLAATAIRRSHELVEASLAVDRLTTPNLQTLRRRAQANAVLTWLQTALAGDLEARWRGTELTLPSTEPLPEVLALGAMVRTLDRTIASLTDDATGIGISRSYVPLLARTSPADVQTNFDRLFEIATVSVARSVDADAKAKDSQRTFDRDASAIGEALNDELDDIVFTLSGLCGNDFTTSGEPNRDLEACGKTGGAVRQAVLAVETELLELLRAQQQLAAQYDLYASRTQTYAAIHQVQAEHIAFVDTTHEALMDLRRAETQMNSAAALVGGLAMGAQTNPWAAAGGAALGLGAGIASSVGESMAASRDRLKLLLKSEALRVEYEIVQLEHAQDLYEAALQFQQLETQVAIKASEVARAYEQVALHRETVSRLMASFRDDTARLARLGSFETDPSFRIERNSDAAVADRTLSGAKRDLYLATRALEYETNTDLSGVAREVLLAPNAAHLDQAHQCVADAWNQWRLLVSSTNRYVTEISLAKDVLGISGPVTDEQTGEVLDEGRQFRRLFFDQPYSPDGKRVWPALRFGTTLNRENGLFSTLLCNDRIESLEVKLVGSGLQGARGEVQLYVDGSSKLRSCAATENEEELVAWNLRPGGQLAPAVVSAGINDYDTASSPNRSFLDYAVSQDTVIVALPDGTSSPANQSVDPLLLEDIVLRVSHTAVAAGTATGTFNPTCK